MSKSYLETSTKIVHGSNLIRAETYTELLSNHARIRYQLSNKRGFVLPHETPFRLSLFGDFTG
jgi:hypothetical protein